MDSVLQDIPDVICYLDDILISSKDGTRQLETYEEVLTRSKKNGFLMREQCTIFLSSSLSI